MGDVTPFTGGLPAAADLNALANAAASKPSNNTMPFLKLPRARASGAMAQRTWRSRRTRSGRSTRAASTTATAHGSVTRSKPAALLAELMIPISQKLPAISTLDDQNGELDWQRQVSFVLACTNGEDEGQNVLYKVSSRGGQTLWADMAAAIAAQGAKDPTKIVPLIVMKSESYKHKRWGLTYNPIFEIVGFAGLDGVAEEPKQKAAAKKKTKAVKPAAEEEVAEEAPVRRRRRRG